MRRRGGQRRRRRRRSNVHLNNIRVARAKNRVPGVFRPDSVLVKTSRVPTVSVQTKPSCPPRFFRLYIQVHVLFGDSTTDGQTDVRRGQVEKAVMHRKSRTHRMEGRDRLLRPRDTLRYARTHARTHSRTHVQPLKALSYVASCMRGTSAFKYIRRRRFARTKPNGSARRLASIELSLPGKLFDGKGNLEIRQAQR